VVNDGVGLGVVVSGDWWMGLKDLVVGVVIYDGLEWVMAWRQLGVKRIWIEAATEQGRSQWLDLHKAFGNHLDSVRLVCRKEIGYNLYDYLFLRTRLVVLSSSARTRGDSTGFINCPTTP
jgi:hypothetical protein